MFLSKHAITLKSVDFGNLSLETGSWKTVFIGMRHILILDSISIEGNFWRWDYPGSPEITTNWGRHGRKSVRYRAIEDFIQCKTNNNPFDLL